MGGEISRASTAWSVLRGGAAPSRRPRGGGGEARSRTWRSRTNLQSRGCCRQGQCECAPGPATQTAARAGDGGGVYFAERFRERDADDNICMRCEMYAHAISCEAHQNIVDELYGAWQKALTNYLNDTGREEDRGP